MKLLKLTLVALVALSLTACSRVEPGYVGLKVNLLGGDKGMDTQELGVGKYWIGMNEELYTFPTFSQSMVWTKNPTEGSPNDDSMSFQTKEGLSANTDVGITYAIDPKRVSTIFQKYRKGIGEITSVYLRSMVRDAFVTEASKRPIESVYGEGKSDLVAAVQQRVIEQTAPIGIIVEKIYLVGDLRLPEVVVSAINAKIGATQKAAQRENEVAQSTAEAQKAVVEARGRADAKLIEAQAEAKAMQIKGEALRSSPELVQLTLADKWNGVLPTYSGMSGTPLLNIK